MKPQISNLQLVFIAGNLTIAGALISLPQALVDQAMNNTWVVPFLMFLFISLLMFVGLSGTNKMSNLDLFSVNRSSWVMRLFGILMLLFLIMVIIRDLRIIIGFTITVLLPTTPVFVLTMLVVLTIAYLAWAGIEVIARFHEMYFSVFILVVLFIPFSLLNKTDLTALEPILRPEYFLSITQSTYLGLAWFGEVVIILLIVGMVKPLQDTRRSVMWGLGIGSLLLFIVLFNQITVIGPSIVKYAMYPSYLLVQQISITEFLDRLELVLVGLYFPTIFMKLAFSLYALNKSFGITFKTDSKHLIVPLSMLMGILSILMFENKTEKFYFATFSWASMGLLLEVILVGLFMYLIRKEKKGGKGNTASKKT
jgi:spore germination protein (amino acid permease)